MTGDERWMQRAMELAASVRTTTSPNPWVGSVVVSADGDSVGEGATAPPGGPHAEVVALAAARGRAGGGTLYATLEPCAHQGRTPPCTEAIVRAGIVRVVVAIGDPDPSVGGRGLDQLRAAGVEVASGVLEEAVTAQLKPYLVHRRTGRPFVVLKLASTLDGRTAAPDGSSRWITGPEARKDVHRLRAESDAVLVGAGTVRADDPSLTVRAEDGDGTFAGSGPAPGAMPGTAGAHRQAGRAQPLRVVLGRAPAGARVHPALEVGGDLEDVLDELGRRQVVQLLVEGGSHVAREFHAAGLVDRYVWYLAPAFLGGDDGRPVFAGHGAPTMAEAWRGRLVSVRQIGGDLRVDLEPIPERRPPLGSGWSAGR